MTEPQPAPKRLRAADVIAQQQAIISMLTNRGGGEKSSVTLARNAKGETQIEVLIRTDDERMTTAAEVTAEARRIYDELCLAYPTGTGYVRNEGQPKPGEVS